MLNKIKRYIFRFTKLLIIFNPFLWKRLSLDKKRYLFIFAVALILILAPSAFYFIFNATKASAAWFDGNWSYRQTIPITNNGSEQTDFQVLVTIDTATLISSKKLRSDCNDIRFLSQDGKILPYFQNTACNAAKTRYWVKVNKIPVGSSNIYLYYGNPSAVKGSSRDAVFDLNLMGVFSQQFTDPNIATDHGLTSDRESNFYISQSTYVNRFNDSWVYQQQYSSLDVYTGVCYDDKNDIFYGIDWTNKQWSAFTKDFVEQAPMDQAIGNAPIDCTTDSTFIYTNHREGLIKRNAIADNSSSSINMDSLTGFDWGGQGLTYAFGYLFAGTSGSYGENGNRVYVIDISNWSSPKVVKWFSVAGHTTGEVAGLTWKGKYIYQSERNLDYINAWTGPVKTSATEPTISNPANEEKTPNPGSYWKFDEGTGTIAKDSTENGNNGTITAASWQSEDQCISGKCLKFDGLTTGVYINGSATLNPDQLTVSTWIKLNSYTDNGNTDATVISNYAGLKGFIFYISAAGKVCFRPHDGAQSVTITSNRTVPLNTWTHITASTDGTNVYIYINGLLDKTGTGTLVNLSSNALAIGKASWASSSYVNGFIDEPKLYPYVRTDDQIKSDYVSRGAVKGVSSQIGGDNQLSSSLSQGLVGYWKMDEATWSGTLSEVVDSSGAGNNGQAQGATNAKAYPSSGKYGNGGYLDGIDDYITAPDSSALAFGTNDFSISTWFKLSDYTKLVGEKGFINKYLGGYNGWRLEFINNRLQFYAGDGGSAFDVSGSFSSTISDNNWHYVSVVVDRKNSKVYFFLDGKPNGSANISSTTDWDTAATLFFAKQGWSSLYYPEGKFDETRIYNRALSANEIEKLFNWTPGPIAYYDFEEKSGSVLDKSGNGLSGSWGGSADNKYVKGKYGSAANFNGTNNTISVTAGNDSILDGANGFTYSLWLKRTEASTSQWPVILGISNPHVYYAIRSQSYGTGITLEYATSPYAGGTYNNVGSSTLPFNEWHHFSATYDGTTVKLYKDAVLMGQVNVVLNPTFTTPFYINTGGFKGQIDEVRIYNYARTPGQITEDMNAGHAIGGSPIASQVGYWKFDEGVGSIIHNSGNGGTALDGIFTGTAKWAKEGKIGKAVDFNGVNNPAVSIPHNASIDFANRSFSVSMWGYYRDYTYPRAWFMARKTNGCYAAGNPGWDFGHQYNANGLNVCYSDGVNIRSSGVTFDTGFRPTDMINKWTHLVVVYDLNVKRVKFYVNGVKQTNEYDISAVTGSVSNTLPLVIGNLYGWQTDGFIDEVKVYNDVLTAEEIKLDYNQGKSLVLGSFSDTSNLTGGTIASNSASATYCIPGDNASCAPPVGEWNFEDGQGLTVNDTSGNNNTGSWNGTGRHWTQGKIGKGGLFNGSSDYVNAGNGSKINITGAITLEAWVKPTSNDGNWTSMISKSPKTAYYLMQRDAGKIFTFGAYLSGGYKEASTVDADITLNQWQHIVATYDGVSTLRIFVNGVQKGINTTGSGTIATTAESLVIGASSLASERWLGQLDQVKIFDYARSPSQIAWDYNQGKPVGYWKMDECQGSIAKDSSGNLNNGTISSAASIGTCLGSAGEMWKDGSTGKFNSSLDFDSTVSDKIEIPTNSTLKITDEVSVCAWVYTPSTNLNGGIFEKTVGNNVNTGYLLFSETTNYKFRIKPSSTSTQTVTSNSLIKANTWTHICGTYSKNASGLAKIFINGKLDNSTTFASAYSIATGDGISYIGTLGQSTGVNIYPWNGQIDDVRIYSYALTDNQVKTIMNQDSAVRWGPVTGTPQ